MSWLFEPITEQWLKDVGFRWHQLDRQPAKQWLLWLGDSLREGEEWSCSSYEDLGIELAPNDACGNWFCWLRADYAGRYGRFLHVRHLKERGEVIQLVVALTGCSWEPTNHLQGCVMRPERAASVRRDRERLDQALLRQRPPQNEVEKDDTRGRALSQHLLAAVEKGGAQ